MGQQNTGLKRIKEITNAATVTRHAAGEKVFVAHNNRGEYVLITKLFTGKESEVEDIIDKRKKIKGTFIAELIESGKENENYCTNVQYMHLLFKRPSKSLLEEINNRRALDEWFNEGEVMMVAYCALEGLKLLSEMSYEYDINVDETTLFVSNDGVIVLSDTEQYTDRIGNKHYLPHRENKNRNREIYNLYQLGVVLDHLQKGSRTSYSPGLKQFIEYLIKGQIQSYNLGLQYLYHLKKTSKNAQQKDAMLSLMSLCRKSNKHSEAKSQSTTVEVARKRSPLGELNLNNNIQRDNGKQVKTKKMEEVGQRKENSCLAYKSQFQAGVMQTLTEENRLFQEGQTLRLDELSSIVGGLSKQLDQEQQQSTFLLQDLDKPEKNTPLVQSNANLGNFLQIPMFDLFSPSRPERLKQLVLNQKGIIYEQSGDELQSLASQRTFRHKNNLQ